MMIAMNEIRRDTDAAGKVLNDYEYEWMSAACGIAASKDAHDQTPNNNIVCPSTNLPVSSNIV